MRKFGLIYAVLTVIIFCIFPGYPKKVPVAENGDEEAAANPETLRKSLRGSVVDNVDRSSSFTTHSEEEEDLVNPDKEITTCEIIRTK